MTYDGIMFGNGMSLNLLQQLRGYIPTDKQYLLDIDDFLKYWINGKITKREERILYHSLYGNKIDKWNFFEKLKNDLQKYYDCYNADIEYVLGTLLFEETEYKEMISFFPALYNIWHIVLMDYLKYLDLFPKIQKYYESVKRITGNPQYIWTTNFDLYGESIKPEHIHGRFLVQMKKYEDVVYKKINNGKKFYFKYIWGHNGIGKLRNIEQIMRFADYSNFFDFKFFFDSNIRMDTMLIYGMGFRKAGFVNELATAYSKYNKAALGAIIDEHILMRINGMITSGMLNHVDITFFDEKEKIHLKEAMEATMVNKYQLIHFSDLNFTIA